jgi:hypothetical protein
MAGRKVWLSIAQPDDVSRARGADFERSWRLTTHARVAIILANPDLAKVCV